MLSPNEVVAVKNAIELTYDCTCTVTEHTEQVKANHSTGFVDEVTISNQSCKLSFEKITNTNQSDISAKVVQSVKLFIAPDNNIKPGSKISVTNRLGVTTEYKSSGEPAVYETHQEIMLVLFEGWA